MGVQLRNYVRVAVVNGRPVVGGGMTLWGKRSNLPSPSKGRQPTFGIGQQMCWQDWNCSQSRTLLFVLIEMIQLKAARGGKGFAFAPPRRCFLSRSRASFLSLGPGRIGAPRGSPARAARGAYSWVSLWLRASAPSLHAHLGALSTHRRRLVFWSHFLRVGPFFVVCVRHAGAAQRQALKRARVVQISGTLTDRGVASPGSNPQTDGCVAGGEQQPRRWR